MIGKNDGTRMLISFCIPVHNRTYDLKRTMPHLVAAANACPPVEIMVLDYNSPDDLGEYVRDVLQADGLGRGVTLAYAKYTGRDYYHMAHARNLSVLAAAGEYIVIMSADIYPVLGFLEAARQLIAERGYTWMYDERYRGVIVCKRQEFIDAGGYDERFEFYGPEDRDLDMRLRRRGDNFGLLPAGLLNVIRTPDREKAKNYRLALSKDEMSARMHLIFEENNARGVTIANLGRGWGQWT